MRPWLIALAIILIFLILYVIFKDKLKIIYVGLGNKRRIQKKLYKECKANDYLIINDLYVQIAEGKYRHLDTLIFGDKYLYIVNEIVNLGTLKGMMDDRSWCLYYNDEMELINNPFIENQRKITRLSNLIELDMSHFKSIVLLADTVIAENINPSSDFEYLCTEKDVIKTIKIIEKKSPEHPYDPKDAERYARAFYLHSLECEKEIKKLKKGKKKNVI